MTFAAPLFLAAALAAAIPIVLHMVNRRKATELPFATLRFLRISAQKTRRRKQIHDLLLMLVRAALLLLIAVGLARPAVTSLGVVWGGAQSAAVIVLDNSASMGQIDQDRTRFDTAVAAAGQILDQLGDGDQVALLPTCGPVFPEADKLDRSQETARRVLAECRVSYERADLPARIQRAGKLLEQSEAANRHIYVVCDMQKVSWNEGREGSILTAGEIAYPLVIIDCNRTPRPDAAVQGVEVESAVPLANTPVKAAVTLWNASTVPQQRRIELWIDGQREASSPELPLPPEERAAHVFPFQFKRGGLHRGEVRLIGDDGSKYDDRRYFAMSVGQNIPVAIVRAARPEIPYLDDAYYLERAIAPGGDDAWAVQTASLLVGDLADEPLDKYKIIYCVNLPALGAEAAARLKTYLRGGGNVVWICGDNVVPEAYNRMNEQADSELLPAPLVDVRVVGPPDHRDSWHIAFLDKECPALARLTEPASLYESVLVTKHVRMATAEGGVQALARLDDGETLLAMRRVGKGRSLLLGVSTHVQWSNLPLRPIFLPLLARLTFYLAEFEERQHNAIAGQPLIVQFPDQAQPIGVEVLPPGGETLRLKTEASGADAGQTFRYADTHEIGVYQLRTLNTVRPEETAYAVNFDPDETDPAVVDHEELRKRFEPTPLLFAENPEDLSGMFAMLREGKSLWSVFLSAVLVGLVFETFLSNRLSPKREDASSQPPPGMRRLAKK